MLLAAACLFIQEADAAHKHVEDAQKSLKNAPAIAFDEELTRVRRGVHVEDRSRARITVKRSNLLRLEIPSKEKGGGHLVVLDGEKLWHLDRTANTVAEFHQDETNEHVHLRRRLPASLFLGTAAARLKAEGVKDVKVGQEKLLGTPCVVITWKERDPTAPLVDVIETYQLFLDPTKLPRRMIRSWKDGDVETTETTDYSNFDLAPKIGKDTFTFTPPEGATKKELPGPAR